MLFKKKELPFDEKPLVCQYLLSAYSLGIIQANSKELNKDLFPWLSSKFVNCSFDSNQPPEIDSKFSVMVFDGDATNDQVLCITPISIPIDSAERINGECFIGLLNDLMSTENYIVGMFNEKYIPSMASYHKKDAPHTFLLFGFDNETQQYSSAGFIDDLRFSNYSVSYDDFLKSIVSLEENRPNVILKAIKYNADKEFVVNYPRIIQVLSDYLNSENNMRPGCPESEVFGLSAIRALSQFFIDCTEKTNTPLDVRYSRGLSDSKKVTAQGVEFQCDYFTINDPKSISMAKEVSKVANLIHLMAIKYNISKDRDLLQTISDCFERIIELEQIYMTAFLEKLKSIKDFPPGTFV